MISGWVKGKSQTCIRPVRCLFSKQRVPAGVSSNHGRVVGNASHSPERNATFRVRVQTLHFGSHACNNQFPIFVLRKLKTILAHHTAINRLIRLCICSCAYVYISVHVT